jgi:hypothetical protein
VGLESSHERTEQMLPQLAPTDETTRQQGVKKAYGILMQQNDKADSTSNDLEEMESQLIAWLQMPNWDTSRTYLQEHPHLLTELAEQVLEQLKQVQPEEEMQELISESQMLLYEARTWGIDGTYTYFQLAEQATTLFPEFGAIG